MKIFKIISKLYIVVFLITFTFNDIIYAEITNTADYNFSHLSTLSANIEGAGTITSPYLVKTEEQLISIATGGLSKAAHYRLENDIILSKTNWKHLDINEGGVFDGNNHVISNLTITKDNGYTDVGLFGINQGTIKNLTLCVNKIEFSSNNDFLFLGALVGENLHGTIDNCKTTGKINVYGAHNYYNHGLNCIGGLVGRDYGDYIRNSISGCSISGNADYVGGIVGESGINNIENCCFFGEISELNAKYVGGISGNAGYITKCANNGKISVSAEKVAGIAIYDSGSILGYIDRCYNKADITNEKSEGYCFGIGNKSTNCYNTGGIYSSNGIIHPIGDTENCYSLGDISMDYFDVPDNSLGYYIIKSNGKEKVYISGIYNTDDMNIEDLKNPDTFSFIDGFNDVFAIDPYYNNGFPYLKTIGVQPSSLELNQTNIMMNENEVTKLITKIEPSKFKNTEIIWLSTDIRVATVNENGIVNAVGAGKANIYAITKSGFCVSKCSITVLNDEYIKKFMGISINEIETSPRKLINIPIKIERNNGFSKFDIDIEYDNRYLVPVGIDEKMITGCVFNKDISNNLINISYDDYKNITQNGELISISFLVLDDAPKTDTSINIVCNSLKKLNNDYTYSDVENICFPGSIHINGILPEDINNDRLVNEKDAALILEYTLNKNNNNSKYHIQEAENGYIKGEFDNDGKITSSDAAYILDDIEQHNKILKELGLSN